MLLRSALRRAATATAASRSSYSSKAKTKGTTTNKGKIHVKGSRAAAAATPIDDAPPAADGINAEYELPKDPLPPSYDPALDVGPGGRPLFSFSQTLGPLTSKNAGTYIDFSMDELKTMLPEGLPSGMTKEFEETRRCAVLVRQSFLDLRDNYRRIVDPPVRTGKKGPKAKKQIVLDGPVSCGKSIALAMLVHWARSEGWLVFYVPKAREWTHGGFFYRNPYNDLWDTPVQAAKILQDFLKFNDSQLQQLPCQTFDPIPLGEGPGIGMMKGVDSMAMPEGSTLSDLIQTGINYPHASVGVVVRLRKELSLVKDIPVLFAIDQYNNWFTFSEYQAMVREWATTRGVAELEIGAWWAEEMRGGPGYRAMEVEAVRRHHRHDPTDRQCSSALVRHIKAPVNLVWSLVRSFDQPQRYKPFVSRCVVRGDLEIGSLREVNVKTGLPATTSTERLEMLDDDEHVLVFKIIGGDHRLRNYSSVLTAHPEVIDGKPGTMVIESFVVDVPEGNTKDETCYFVEALIKCNLKSLADVSEGLASQDSTGPMN